MRSGRRAKLKQKARDGDLVAKEKLKAVERARKRKMAERRRGEKMVGGVDDGEGKDAADHNR